MECEKRILFLLPHTPYLFWKLAWHLEFEAAQNQARNLKKGLVLPNEWRTRKRIYQIKNTIPFVAWHTVYVTVFRNPSIREKIVALKLNKMSIVREHDSRNNTLLQSIDRELELLEHKLGPGH